MDVIHGGVTVMMRRLLLLLFPPHRHQQQQRRQWLWRVPIVLMILWIVFRTRRYMLRMILRMRYSSHSLTNTHSLLHHTNDMDNDSNEGEQSVVVQSAIPLNSSSSAHLRPFPKRTVLVTRHILFTSGENDQIEWIQDGLNWLRMWLTSTTMAAASTAAASSKHNSHRQYQLMLITHCQEDESESRVIELLKREALFTLGLEFHNVLFCGTSEGAVHMGRQLEPDLYIDSSSQRILQMKPFVPHAVLVGSESSLSPQLLQEAENTTSSSSTRRISVVTLPHHISAFYG